MATQSEAVAWANAQIGKSINVDGVYGAQCVDLIAAYTYDVFGQNVMGANRGNTTNAVNLITIALPAGYTRIQNSASFIPQPGDIFIFDKRISIYGHTGIVISANMNSFVSIDQNWINANNTVGSPAARITHNYNAFWGVIRPTYNNQGGNNAMTPNFIRRTYYMVNDQTPTQQEVDFHMAKCNPESFINGFGDYPLWRARTTERDNASRERDAARKDLTTSQVMVKARDEEITRLKKELSECGVGSTAPDNSFTDKDRKTLNATYDKLNAVFK